MTEETQTPQDRPLVTFALFAYNQEKYIREAVEGAFSQTYEPLEIILSDDCSSDRTFDIMQEMAAAYDGPHLIVVRKSAVNNGLANHLNAVLELATGEYYALAAGDDISEANRTEMCMQKVIENSQLKFVETATQEISDAGQHIRNYRAYKNGHVLTLNSLIKKPATGLIGAARLYHCDVFKKFPPLNQDCPTEDTTSVLRSLIVGNGQYLGFLGVKRRIHASNLSSASSIQEMKLDRIYNQYLADIKHARITKILSNEQSIRLTKALRDYIKERKVNQLVVSGASLSQISSLIFSEGIMSFGSIKVFLRFLRRRALDV